MVLPPRFPLTPGLRLFLLCLLAASPFHQILNLARIILGSSFSRNIIILWEGIDMPWWSMICVLSYPHCKNRYFQRTTYFKLWKWEKYVVLCKYMLMGLVTRKWKPSNPVCIIVIVPFDSKVQHIGHVLAGYLDEKYGIYDWSNGQTMGLYLILWAWDLTLPLINFVSLDNLLLSVNLNGSIYWSKTGTLVVPIYWVNVRIKCGDAWKVLSRAWAQ
jgi:hypothetical protein